MSRPGKVGPVAAKVLRYLVELDRRKAGYERLSVRGWALRTDIEQAVGARLSDELVTLERRGLVITDDVAPRGPVRRVNVYRATARGAQAVASDSGNGVHAIQPPPGERREADHEAFVPPGALVALLHLRELRSTAPSWVPGELGWVTEEELLDRVLPDPEALLGELLAWESGDAAWKGTAPAVPRLFARTDLPWLQNAGYAQRWGVTPDGRVRPVIVWRCTPAGLGARVLQWAEGGP